jgi:hypothetical protein
VAQLVGDYKNPILKPEAAETVRKHGEESKAHFGFHNPRNQCWPNGLPFVLSSNGLQIFDRGDHLTMIYHMDHQLRTVRMNGSHPPKVTPSYYGDSIGHYEGDTLVVDTVGIKVGRVTMADAYGSPQSEAMHVVERYRRAAAQYPDPERRQHPFAQRDVGEGLDELVLVRAPDDARFPHRRVRQQRVLDLHRAHRDTAHLQHVVGAPRVPEEALLVLRVLVSGADPRAGHGLLRPFVLVPIAAAGRVTLDQEAADVSRPGGPAGRAAEGGSRPGPAGPSLPRTV